MFLLLNKLFFNNIYNCFSYRSIKSTEQLELEKIEKLKHEAKKNKALSKKSFKKTFAHKPATGPVKAIKPPTEPVEFHFKTDERIKTKDTPTTSSSTELQFPMNLRSSNRPDYIPGDPSEVSNDVYSVVH